MTESEALPAHAVLTRPLPAQSVPPRPVLAKDVQCHGIDRGAVILNFENGEYFRTGPSGRLILEGIGAGASLEALARSSSAAYGLDFERALRDVERFVEELAGSGLVVLE